MYTNKTLQKDISFSHKVQMVQAKMNSYLNIPAYSLISIIYTSMNFIHKYTNLHTYTKFLSYNIILGTIVLSILFFIIINVQFINHSLLTADAFSLASASPDIELIRRKSFNVLLPRKQIQIDLISEKLIFLRIHDETTEYG